MGINSVKWIFVLEQDFDWSSAGTFDSCYAFEDRDGVRRMEIYPDGRVRVLAGYAWDGCTPKFSIWDIVIGTPDGIPNSVTKKPKAYYASLVHDALYQFLDVKLPLTRAEADEIFYLILARDEFGPRKIYYLAVRIFGGLFRLFTRWKRDYNGRRVAL